MFSLVASNRTILLASVLLPTAMVLMLMGLAPGHGHVATYAAAVALVVAAGAVASTTWRHAQPVASLRQELYAINHPMVTAPGSPWQRWLVAGARSDARGRALSVFALSVGITAIIAYAWFA